MRLAVLWAYVYRPHPCYTHLPPCQWKTAPRPSRALAGGAAVPGRGGGANAIETCSHSGSGMDGDAAVVSLSPSMIRLPSPLF